jgi:undecaprenyl diphosphate synthase
MRPVVRRARDRGVETLSVYTFSTENWTRPDDEVSGLFGLIDGAVRQYTEELIAEGVQVRVIGRLHEAPGDVQRSIRAAEERTAGGSRMTLNICFNYSGRAEIVDAARALVAAHADPNAIDEAHFAEHLYTVGQAEVDLLIRAGGDRRTSNFLLWQAAYAELVFCEKFWPDFTADDFDAALDDFASRQRRFGG